MRWFAYIGVVSWFFAMGLLVYVLGFWSNFVYTFYGTSFYSNFNYFATVAAFMAILSIGASIPYIQSRAGKIILLLAAASTFVPLCLFGYLSLMSLFIDSLVSTW